MSSGRPDWKIGDWAVCRQYGLGRIDAVQPDLDDADGQECVVLVLAVPGFLLESTRVSVLTKGFDVPIKRSSTGAWLREISPSGLASSELARLAEPSLDDQPRPGRWIDRIKDVIGTALADEVDMLRAGWCARRRSPLVFSDRMALERLEQVVFGELSVALDLDPAELTNTVAQARGPNAPMFHEDLALLRKITP